MWKQSKYIVTSHPFLDSSCDQVCRVIFSTRQGKMERITETLWQMMTESRWEDIPNALMFSWLNKGFVVPLTEDELETILKQNEAARCDDKGLYIVIHPSSWCPLGCFYCGQVHKKQRLGQEQMEQILARVKNKLKARFWKELEIGWFGAEPLTGLGQIRYLTPKLQGLAQANGCVYKAKMVTNGLALNLRVAQELVLQHGVRHIEVTLDGTPEYHDNRRHTKTGKDSFKHIFNNLKAVALCDEIAEAGCKLTIRANIDETNRESFGPLMKMLAEEGLQKRIAGIYAAPVHSWGNDADKLSIHPEVFAKLEVDWFIEQFDLGFQPVLLPSRSLINCMTFKPEAELIDADGVIHNCSETSYVPSYEKEAGEPRSNEYAIGTLEEGEIPLRRKRLEGFYEKVREGAYPCDICPMLPVCGGACPKLWEEGKIPCPSAKYNISERLILEYARICQAL